MTNLLQSSIIPSMVGTEINTGIPGSPEILPHRLSGIVIGLTQSPEGKRCVGMTYNKEEWLLLTAKPAFDVDGIREMLEQKFDIKSITGPAINWRQSLAAGEVVLLTNRTSHPDLGIYVSPQCFDELTAFFSDL